LGNPGGEYKTTRHNIGFELIDAMSENLSLTWKQQARFSSLIAEGSIDGKKIILLKPQTFMNESGIAVARVAHQFKIPSTQIWVISDDATLPFGMMRIRTGGSAGGHNGLKSIIAHLKTETFGRVRMGVGTPPAQMPLDRFVLSRLTANEQHELAEMKNAVVQELTESIARGALLVDTRSLLG
jgi:PTH1 family peptidyl-tRNA hydrolase